MIDTTQLNTLIAALKAETQKDAITPVSLGSILEKISQLLATASTSSDTSSLSGLQTALTALQTRVNSHITTQESVGSVIYGIANGSDNQAQVNLTLSKVDVSSNSKGTASLVIGAATTQRAGAMTSQHVTDLNTAKSDAATAKSGVTSLQGSLTTVQNSVASVQTSVTSMQSSVGGLQTSVGGLQTSVGSMQTSVSTLQTLVTALQSAVSEIEESIEEGGGGSSSGGSESSTPFYHIECQARTGEGLHVIGANKLIALGYKPYLFRYSKKKCRYRFNQYGPRRKGRKQRGWNLFCQSEIVAFGEKDLMKIAKHNNEGLTTQAVYTDPVYLFSSSKIIDPDDGDMLVLVAYGCETKDVTGGKRLRFGIAFGEEQTKDKFDFAKLVTNIAEFGVQVEYNASSTAWCHLRAHWAR